MTHRKYSDMKKFKEWLKTNTRLRIGSIRLYFRTINSFWDSYEELNTENINAFVTNSFRNAHSYYVKYAFRHYLKFLRKLSLYSEIVSIKIEPRKKMGKYLPPETIRALIGNIKDSRFQDWARIQYAVGCRARGLISLRAENIDFSYNPDIIKVRLEEKAGAETLTFLSKDFKPILEKYMPPNNTGFLFLPAEAPFWNEEDLLKRIDTLRTYYERALIETAKSMGLERFGTHDFRRNVAEEIMKQTKDIRKVQRVLNHKDIRTTMHYFPEQAEMIRDSILSHQKTDVSPDRDNPDSGKNEGA